MKKKMGLLLFVVLFLPFNVKAESFSVNMSCPESAKAGEKVNCIITLDPQNKTLNTISASYNIPTEVSYDSFNASNGRVGSSDSSGFRVEGDFSMPLTLGSLTVQLPSDANSNSEYKISLVGISANDVTSLYTASNTSSTIRIKSTENRLSSLSISGGSINFNQDTNNYNVTIDSDSAVITAAKVDTNSIVSGNIGTVSLNYGENIFKINVTSELGDTRTYQITVIRPDSRSKNNNLSSLIVTNTDINFDKDTTTYNLTTISSETLISATKEDTKATVLGSTGKQSLSYGLNTFSLQVVAEDGSTKTYTLNITRKDNRSDNNYLKSLSLSKGKINFNKNTTTYNVDVDNDVEKVTVTATLDDSKASFVDGYGTKEVSLSLGNNTVYIKVLNEKGELRTYTLNINRDDGRSSDSSLKEIKLTEGKIDFKTHILEYKVNVEYEVETIEIQATATSDKSKITIEGDKNLIIGENIFTITVEAENGKQSTYKVTIIRKEDGYNLSSNNYIKSLTIKNHSLNFSSDVHKYTIKTKEDKLNLNIVLEDDKSEYEVTGNNDLKDGSKITIKVTAENGDIRTYMLNIDKTNNMLIIVIIILITIITGGLITIILLKRKKRLKIEKDAILENSEKLSNSIEKKEIHEINSDDIIFTDEDFTEFQ